MGKRKRRQRTSSNKKKLKKRLQADPSFKNLEIVEASDEEKMSAVILRFVKPYRELATSKQAFEMLIILAMVAWNSTLQEGADRQQLLDMIKETMPSSSDPEWNQETEQLLAMLIQRKERYFADNKRFIIDYRVSESKSEYNLAIISTPL